MKKILIVLVAASLFQIKDSYSQEKFIDIEFSPIILDMGNSPFKEFKGIKVNIPIYFDESWSISPYLLMNRRNLNAYDTYGAYYDDIIPSVLNFIGIRINKDFPSSEPINFRIFGGINYQIVTAKYFGTKISSNLNPNIGGSLKWAFSPRLSLIVDVEIIKIIDQSKGDNIQTYIENGNYIPGDVGEYEFDGDENASINIGLVFSIRKKNRTD